MKVAHRTVSVALFACGMASSSAALAHGGIPRAYQILFESGNPQHVVLRSDLWGFFDTRDGGRTWNYVCAEAWGGISSQLQNRTLAVMPGGRFLIATYFDGIKVSDDLCTWRKVAAFADESVSVVVPGPDVSGSAYAVTATGSETGIDGQVWRSLDRGDTWVRLGPKLATDFSGISLAFAPSDPKRMYLAGNVVDHGGARMLASSDGGVSWQSFVLPVMRSDEWNPRVVVIDPKRPDIVILRIDGMEGYGENVPDELWATTDGGKSWSKIYEGAGDLPGTTVDPASGNLFVAGPLEGVKSAPIDMALSNGQAAFHQVQDGMAYGLRVTSEGLLIGGDNYGARGVPEYTLGASKDQAQTVSTLMTMCDLRLAQCDPGSTVGMFCSAIWSGDETALGFKAEYIAPRCPSTPDAGTSSGAGGTSGVAGASGTPSSGAPPIGGVVGGNGGVVPSKAQQSAGCSCGVPFRASSEGTSFTTVALMGILVRLFSRRRVRAALPSS